MGEIWKGAPVAAALCASLTGRISALRAAGVEPALAILRAGERGDDIAYENGAVKRCEKLGIAVRRVRASGRLYKGRGAEGHSGGQRG